MTTQSEGMSARTWFEIMGACAFVVIGWVACFNAHQAGIGVFVFYIAAWFLLRRHETEPVDWDAGLLQLTGKKTKP